MSDTISTLAAKLRPHWLRDLSSNITAVSAAGTPGVTDHGALSGLFDDDHPQYLTPVRADVRYLTASRNIIAGNGLTGGGALTADVTLNVAVANTGAAGLTVEADAVRLTSSSDVGTTPAAAILASTAGGALTLSSLFVKGSVSLTNNGDLTVAGSGSYAGSDVLFVDSSGGNVGILMVPDSQFALDVNGPARATYFVGPHAIQLKNVVLLSHFDGRMPYNTNYYGEPNGHMGQVATVAGGVTYRPGKFYKALQVAETAYNYCPNPSSELDASGWTQQYNGGTLTGQTRLAVTDAPYGQYAIVMTASASSSYTFNAPHFHAPASVTMTWNPGQSATLSCYVWGSGTWRVVLEDDGQNLNVYQDVTLSTTAEWQRVVLTATNGTGFNHANVRLSFFPRSAGGTLAVDGVHYEANNRATPYLDGSMGNSPGHAWNGTAHASYSVRNAASLYYSQPMPTTWTIMFWAYRAAWQAGTTGYLLSYGSGTVYYNSSNVDIVGPTTSTAPSTGWHHYCVMYDSAGITRAYRDGAYLGQTSAARTDAAVIYVGWNGAGAQSNSLIDDLCLLERAMDVAADNSCDELRTVYESNAPVFAETSTFSFRPTPKGLLWADDDGLWMKATDGDTVLGVYGNDATTKSWGGQTMSAGDLLIGNATNYMFWDDSAATLTVAGNGAGLTAINGGNITTGTVTATQLNVSTLSAITANMGSLTSGSVVIGSTNKIWLNDSSDGALNIGGSTKASAPFRVTAAGALTATSATVTGSIGATGGGVISGNWYVGYDVSYAGSMYFGSGGKARVGTNGMSLVMENLGSSPTIPTSSSALRWFPDISESYTHTNAKNYSGIIGYKHTGQKVIDNIWTAFVGSDNISDHSARVMLQSGNHDGATYRGVTLQVIKDPGANTTGTVYTDATYTNLNGMLGLYPKAAATFLNGMAHIYYSAGGNLVIAYYDGSTTKYRYTSLTGTANPAVWTYSTSAPP
jgi:hypothetical protein